jgi:nucleoside-diphosphate-sugar epimerase
MSFALVTGATGFLGSRLAFGLLGRGVRVRALARPTSSLRRLDGMAVEIVRGSLEEPASLLAAARGQDVVLHAAAKVPDWGTRREYMQTNLEGTRNLIAACRQAGVARLVYVSSLTVLGLSRSGMTVDETAPYAESARDPYTASKIAAEKLVLAAHGQHGLATTIVRPGGIWGPGDATLAPRIATLLRRGHMPYIDGGRNRIALSHVRNLAEAILLAADRPGAGQIFHVTDGEEPTARAALDALAAALGVRPPRFSVPFATIYAAATLVETAARLARAKSPPPLTRYGVRLVASDARYSIAKAEAELGYRPRVGLREGIEELAAELRVPEGGNGRGAGPSTSLGR